MRKLLINSLFSTLLLWQACTNEKDKPIASINFNNNWQFVKDIDTIINESLFERDNDKIEWENISLPHTANIEPLVIEGQQWQGDCFYRKFFKLPNLADNQQVFLCFGAAMHEADIYLNGKSIDSHIGGYLPFYVNMTPYLVEDENCILVKLNNEDNSQIPPGKPLNSLDFNYYGGIYRGVKLMTKNKVHITNPLVKEGGVKVFCRNISEKSAIVQIDANVTNQTNEKSAVHLVFKITSTIGGNVYSTDSRLNTINSKENRSFSKELKIENPKLWSPDNPNRYQLYVEVYANGKRIDNETVTFGIRDIRFTKDGFYLNGKKTNIRGTNRHQDYPYIGYALSDNAQYRDAWKIKQAGFNFVRLSHYPQSKAFMNACDELGIMVMDAIPGWQFFGDSIFQENCYEDIRQMIRRDRNHPSIILWEASLNESGMSKEFMEKSHAIVHEELPGEGVYTCGWLDDVYDVFIPARQHAKAPNYWKKYDAGKPLFIAEYGDWEYYAQNAGFNQAAFANLKQEERTSRQLRAYGQKRLAQQALNYQEAHNDNLYNPASGDANWLMFDYNRGYASDIESSGIMDIFRLPKFACHFYRSQKELLSGDTVLFIANYWNDPAYRDVKIYSNCDEVELYLNNVLLERRKPDTDQNSTNLAHPPFTFTNLTYQAGELKAKAYVNGELVAESTRNTPGHPSRIKLSIDESNKAIKANCNDVVFVYAGITDEKGNYVPNAENKVRFKVEGDAVLIGDNPAISEAGIASILLRAGNSGGEIKISASSNGLETQSLEINVK